METIDYERVIADLEAKRTTFNTAIDNAIQGLRHVATAMSTLPSGSPDVLPQTPAGVLTPDAFFGMGIAQAAVKYLKSVKKQQSSKEIAEGLERANFHHTSKNFGNTVNTALGRRAEDDGDVVKIGRKWALAEWYPGRRRSKSKNGFDEMPAASMSPDDAVSDDGEGTA